MKIAIIGYGKMGKEVEQIAMQRNHQIVLKIEKNNVDELISSNLKNADVAIEFSTPASTIDNIKLCFESGIPVVVGTTGWYESLDTVKENCIRKSASMLYASNFSIGVNIFFELNRKLAAMMKKQAGYHVSLTEIHHTQKLDKPSGTAITLANDILKEAPGKKSWTIDENDADKNEKIFIESIRKGDVVGMHQVRYQSSIDEIEIMHDAKSRKGFAIGAVLAAEWLAGKKGFFTMQDFIENSLK